MVRCPMRVWILLAASVLILGSCIRPGGDDLLNLDLPFEHYRLDNGLEVILREDDRIPVASVNVWYHVGPANEVDGRRGFAHLFEHMMLQGSGHAPGDYYNRLQAVGATGVNGNTTLDRTAYLEDVPSDQLELALWAESDRMGFLLDAIDLPTLRNQQSVVRNERRETVDNAPYGLGLEEVYKQLFPPSHPYHHFILGSHADIQSAELEEIRDFFHRYYGPNNASLAIVGNIDIAQTKQLVEKYFGTLRPGPEVPEVTVPVPRITHRKRSVLTDTVELPRVYLAWISPEAFTAGDAQASLAARMLGGGNASRLYRDLVHDMQIAQSVVAEHRGLQHGSVFQITATAKPGHTAEELESAVRQVLDRMAGVGPGEEELAAAKTSTLAIVVKSLEPTDGVADRFNAYNHFIGDPDYLREDLRRFDSVTQQEVQDFVARDLEAGRGVVVAVNPGPKILPPDPPAPPPPPAERRPEPVMAEPWRFEVPQAIDAPPAELPVPESFRLDNGLTVYHVRRPMVPLATVQLTARSGSSEDPEGLEGLASLTSEMLNEGAGDRGSIDIANHLTALGSTLETGSSREGSWVVTQALKENLHDTVQVVADVVLRPSFPAEEVSRVRTEHLAAAQQQRSQPLTSALRVMWQEHYGSDHPYGHLAIGTEAGIAAVEREDIIRFYRRTFTPANSALILTGDLSKREARNLAEDHFGDWKGTAPASSEVPEPQTSSERVLVVDFPGSPQTAVVLSQGGVARQDPDYEKLLILNGVLGDLFSSRLNQTLREVHGYTYGVDSQVTQNVLPGLMHVSMSVETQHTAVSIAEALREITKLKQEGISGTELEESRRAIVRSLPNRFRTNGDVASSIAHLYVLGISQEYFRTLEERLEGVTVSEVAELGDRILDPDGMKVVAAGDRDAIQGALGSLGMGAVSLRSPGGA